MRFRNVAAIAIAASTVAACAGMSRMQTYPHGLADAKVVVGKRHFSVWFHRKDSTVLVQRSFGSGFGQGVASGLTFNAVNFTEPMPYWKAATQAVVGPLGCTVGEVYTLDNRTTWEAHYTCAPGVDVVAQVEAHRREWREGIAVADPMAPSP